LHALDSVRAVPFLQVEQAESILYDVTPSPFSSIAAFLIIFHPLQRTILFRIALEGDTLSAIVALMQVNQLRSIVANIPDIAAQRGGKF
jgi:hypothetical protein